MHNERRKREEKRIKDRTCAGRAVQKYQRRLSDEDCQKMFCLREGGKEVGV